MREFVVFLAVALVVFGGVRGAIVWLDNRLNDRVNGQEVLEYE